MITIIKNNIVGAAYHAAQIIDHINIISKTYSKCILTMYYKGFSFVLENV